MGKHSSEASRAERKARKRKLVDAVPNLPGEKDSPTVVYESSSHTEQQSRKRKRENNGIALEDYMSSDRGSGETGKREGQRRKYRKTYEDIQVEIADGLQKPEGRNDVGDNHRDDATNEDRELQVGRDKANLPKSKKQRKTERKARQAAEARAEETVCPTSIVQSSASTPVEQELASRQSKRNRVEKEPSAHTQQGLDGGPELVRKRPRFIAFIGMFMLLFTRSFELTFEWEICHSVPQRNRSGPTSQLSSLYLFDRLHKRMILRGQRAVHSWSLGVSIT